MGEFYNNQPENLDFNWKVLLITISLLGHVLPLPVAAPLDLTPLLRACSEPGAYAGPVCAPGPPAPGTLAAGLCWLRSSSLPGRTSQPLLRERPPGAGLALTCLGISCSPLGLVGFFTANVYRVLPVSQAPF